MHSIPSMPQGGVLSSRSEKIPEVRFVTGAFACSRRGRCLVGSEGSVGKFVRVVSRSFKLVVRGQLAQSSCDSIFGYE